MLFGHLIYQQPIEQNQHQQQIVTSGLVPSPSTREPSPFFKSAVQVLTTFLFSVISNRKTPLTFLTASALILPPISAKMASDSKRNRGVIEMVLIGWIRAGLMAARASGAKNRVILM